MGTEYWKGLIDWIENVMLKEYDFIDPQDLKVFTMCDDPQEAAEISSITTNLMAVAGSNSRPVLKKYGMVFTK